MLVYDFPSHDLQAPASGRCLFLDRDGVINEDVNYLYRIEDFRFLPGIFDLCRAAAENGFLLIIVSNQSGIARGYYSEEDFRKVTAWMFDKFAEHGIELVRLYACPHLPTADLVCYRRDCPARKPNPGMLLQAQKDFNLDLAKSVFIGNKSSDMEAGLRAGIGSLFLLNNNPEAAAASGKFNTPDSRVTMVSSLDEIRNELFPKSPPLSHSAIK